MSCWTRATFAATHVGQERFHQMIRTQRQAYLSELATLAELGKQYREDPLVALLVEAAVLHTEANLRVLDLAYDRVDHLAGLAPAMQAEEQEVQQAR